ncbi:ATP-binding cassette domain-containing protein [Labrys monachus]|uniref:Sulfonate transport system ATP-binding protein n=1 Tax=Labrys monachus TaxID=217067 RepID=A0ABU0FIA2_9HYPH|nr:ATP-binding cassette domain-containing protein [Labrys monachus]MDQ0394201.1 sulfonate transport system ATP-binding protein [Labrys monachus]
MSHAVHYVEDGYFMPELARSAGSAALPSQAPGPGGLSVELKAVSKAFGHRVVLDRLDIAIPAGAFVAVVGRSGGGKSTLLRLVAGLEKPSGGEVLVGGKAASLAQGGARLMFQEARLLPWQRVIGNVGIARGPGWKKAAQATLDEVGLGDRAGEWPSVLSGGQKQRVALARALVSRPEILLLDEPFGALDAMTRVEMHQLLARIWREHGFTAMLITHDVSEAVALADRVIVLRDGAVALDVAVDLPRPPREKDDPAAARLAARILAYV